MCGVNGEAQHITDTVPGIAHLADRIEDAAVRVRHHPRRPVDNRREARLIELSGCLIETQNMDAAVRSNALRADENKGLVHWSSPRGIDKPQAARCFDCSGLYPVSTTSPLPISAFRLRWCAPGKPLLLLWNVAASAPFDASAGPATHCRGSLPNRWRESVRCSLRGRNTLSSWLWQRSVVSMVTEQGFVMSNWIAPHFPLFGNWRQDDPQSHHLMDST